MSNRAGNASRQTVNFAETLLYSVLRFEVAVQTRFMKEGVFDAQNLVTIPRAKLMRKLGDLSSEQLAEVEEAVRRWLGF